MISLLFDNNLAGELLENSCFFNHYDYDDNDNNGFVVTLFLVLKRMALSL